MEANKPIRTRAINTDQKNLRISAILQAAEKLFLATPLHKIMVNEIAKEAGIAKGSVYVYFSTKEAIYLSLLQREFAGWFTEMNRLLSGKVGTPMGINETVNTITASLSRRELFLRLAAVLHSLLEENTPEEDIRRFKLFLLNEMNDTGIHLETGTSFLPKGEGVKLLVTVYILLLGVKLIASPSAAVQNVFSTEPALAPLRFSFEREFSRALKLHITGLQLNK